MSQSLTGVRRKFSAIAWEYIVLTVGVALYAFAWACMLIPNGIASGGVTGASTIINFATGIPVYLSYIVLNSILLILGFFVLGKGFGFKTIYAIALSTLFLDLLGKCDFLFLTFESKLLLVIVAGSIEAVGIALILARGGSTGGTDIIALLINKFWPVTIGKVYLFCDMFIILSILLVPGKTIEDMVYGYVTMIVFSLVIDWVMLGNKSTWQVLIFSDKYEEIADFIINKMDRGVTALNSIGWYTRKDKKVLLILVRKRELHELTKEIKSIDSKAFVSVSSASTVYGEGFDEMKTGVSLSLKKKPTDGEAETKQQTDSDAN